MKKKERLVLKENLIAFWIACSIWVVFASVVNLAQNSQTNDNLNLKASILQTSSSVEQFWDFSVKKENQTINIISNVDIPWVEAISYNLKYSPNIKIGSINSSYNFSSTDETWNTFILLSQPWAIEKWKIISTLSYSWNKEEIVVGEIEMILADWTRELPSISFN